MIFDIFGMIFLWATCLGFIYWFFINREAVGIWISAIIIAIFGSVIIMCSTFLPAGTRYVELTDKTLVEKNLFGHVYKQATWDNFCAIHNYRLISGDKYGTLTGNYHCLHFGKNIYYARNPWEARKNKDVILIPITKYNTKILRKYLPEKFLPFLDAPIDRSDEKSLNDELLLYDKSKDMELINDPDFTEKENSQQEQKQDEQSNQTDIETVLANADQADDTNLPHEDKE